MKNIETAGSHELDAIGAKIGMKRDTWEGDTSYRRRLKNSGVEEALPGISLHDYFAAKAMQGMNANPYYDDYDFDRIASMAYAQANAMLAERAK